MNMRENGTVALRWIVGLLVTVLIVVASGTTATAVALLRTPPKEQVDRIEERQQMVLQRLAAIDVLLTAESVKYDDLHQRLTALEQLLLGHINER